MTVLTNRELAMPIGTMQPLDGHPFPAYVSRGAEAHGAALADRCARARDWLCGVFSERPELTLFVADRQDWDEVALVPLYGMPHAVRGRLVMGSEPAAFWSDYTDALLEDLPADGRRRLTAVYGDPPALGERLADLSVAHELTHFFHEYDEQTGLTDFPRLWVCELFANIGMHGYIASNEPDQLSVLETICDLTWEAPAERWPVRALDRLEQSLASGPLNYLWFQFRLLVIARKIWQAGGGPALRAFRDNLRQPSLSEDRVMDEIRGMAPDAADALRHWVSSEQVHKG